MKADKLFKNLIEREDMQDIPIKILVKVSIAVIEELLKESDENAKSALYD